MRNPSPADAQITLEPGFAFNAEAYASDLGLASDSDDVRLNLGERLLRALFAQWRQPDGDAPPPVPASASRAAPPELAFRPLNETPVRLSEDGRVVARTLASRLSELPADAVPHWVAQAVLHGQYTPKEPLKMSFFLQPHPDSGLPALPADSSKLSAAKVRMRHVWPRGLTPWVILD
jgi:WD repeat-containing protein 48